jgi:predicted transcriptional regulator
MWKDATTMVCVRIDVDLLEDLDAFAEATERTRTGAIIFAVRQMVDPKRIENEKPARKSR